MSDEVDQLVDEVTDSVKKFGAAPRIKAAFQDASLNLKIAGGLGFASIFAKSVLPIAFASAVYGIYKGVKAFNEYEPPASKPDDLNI